MMQAGMSVPYWNFLTGDSSVERKPYLTMLMMSMMRKDPPYPTNVLEKTYRNLYQMLISKKRRVGLKDVEIAQFLADLEGIIYKTDEKRRYVRRNLLVTAWAAGQVGPHATQINTFFARHAEHIRKWYGIDPHRDEKLGNPPVKHRGKEARRWFKQNLEGSDLQADGTYRERRGLIARLRKRRIKHVDEKNK